MDRRKSIKAIAVSAIAPAIIVPGTSMAFKKRDRRSVRVSFKSDWDQWPDMNWIGPGYWGNRLQDWCIKDGEAVCQVSAPNRTLHNLTTQLDPAEGSFESSVNIRLLNNNLSKSSENYAGFRIGAKGKFADYRSAAVYGEGLDIGISTNHKLIVGNKVISDIPGLPNEFRLSVKTKPNNGTYRLAVEVTDPAENSTLLSINKDNVSPEQLVGNIALVATAASENNLQDVPHASFSNWQISGGKLKQTPEQVFGPICFAQYTLHNRTVKLTAQLAPVERILNDRVELQINTEGSWKTIAKEPIDKLARVVTFRLENWQHKKDVPYRLKLILPVRNGMKEYFYNGTIAAEPDEDSDVKAAVFSCNADYGFPDADIAPNTAFHKPDLALFLGDQFYESTGGFGVQRAPLEKASLDYLRKWMMFGWSYREVFRHIPCAIIPDDHDVYHGNVWGESGKAADTSLGWGYTAQDSGGFKMSPEWVNMVQKTQTSHLPDAFDPTPVKQQIGVYYTSWNYGGISFAILEDRKFKSAPHNILPKEAQVKNGFIGNPNFNIKEYRSEEAELLGDRQLKFLDEWSQDWSENAQMKIVLSQTIFSTVSTLPKGSTGDEMVPKLAIPKPGEYVTGDALNADMDNNGWPQAGRDIALEKIRKCFAFHIAGDQHLASFTKYGIARHGDAGYAFAGPALNNLWPRRWWPPVSNPESHEYQKPAYTGNFEDGFGNKMTVKAVANPEQKGIEPALIHDRATGYGIVTFNKKDRTIHTECWPRYEDPAKNQEGQFPGWPITVKQEDNYGRKAVAWLPEIKVNGIKKPVVKIINEATSEMIYAIRLNKNKFTPKVFEKGFYTILVSDPDLGIELRKSNIKAVPKSRKTVLFSV
jgi:alkaline phosphatase D